MTKTKEIRHFRKPARSGTCSTAIYILGRGCRIWGVPREKRSLQEELAAEASRDLRPMIIPSGK